LAGILKPLSNYIHVEGFTDNIPINNAIFPSNWELSASRSASVVQLFANSGIDPVRLAAIGFGEFHPIADNNTPEGRRKNRRVVLAIKAAPTDGGVLTSLSSEQIPSGVRNPAALPDPVQQEIRNRVITPARELLPQQDPEEDLNRRPNRNVGLEGVQTELVFPSSGNQSNAPVSGEDLPIRTGTFSVTGSPGQENTQ